MCDKRACLQVGVIMSKEMLTGLPPRGMVIRWEGEQHVRGCRERKRLWCLTSMLRNRSHSAEGAADGPII